MIHLNTSPCPKSEIIKVYILLTNNTREYVEKNVL